MNNKLFIIFFIIIFVIFFTLIIYHHSTRLNTDPLEIDDGLFSPPNGAFIVKINAPMVVLGNFELLMEFKRLFYDIHITNIDPKTIETPGNITIQDSNHNILKTLDTGSYNDNVGHLKGVWVSSDEEPLTDNIINKMLNDNLYLVIKTHTSFIRGKIKNII